MVVASHRAKVGNVQMKDSKLYKEIVYNLNKCDDELMWKTIYNDIILQNKKVVSKMKDLDGCCLLHHASKLVKVPVCILTDLIETFPHLIALPNNKLENALILAIRYYDRRFFNSAALKMLKLCPNALEVDALHTALLYRFEEKVIMKIIELFPKALEVPTASVVYALQLAMQQSETVILKMIELFPKALELSDYYGYNALHLAIFHLQSETVILKIIEIFPEALEVCNRWFPLELAIYNKCSETVVTTMLELCPGVIENMNDTTIYRMLIEAKENHNVVVQLSQLTSNKRLKTS